MAWVRETGGQLPVVHELQSDVEFLALEQALDVLQLVLLLRGHPKFFTLDLRPDAFRGFVPDHLRDLLRVLLGDTLLEVGQEAILSAGRLRVAGVENLERNAALDQLLLEHVEYGLSPLLAVRPDLDCLVARPGDGRAHAAEVESRADLLRCLVQRVVDFLVIYLRHDVERGFRCHGIKVRRPGADSSGRFRYPSTCRLWWTALGRLPEWPKGAVCKTVGSAYVGSNPTPATSQSTRSVRLRRLCRYLCACSQMPRNAGVSRWPWDIRGIAGASFGAVECGLDAVVGELLAVVQAFGVDA